MPSHGLSHPHDSGKRAAGPVGNKVQALLRQAGRVAILGVAIWLGVVSSDYRKSFAHEKARRHPEPTRNGEEGTAVLEGQPRLRLVLLQKSDLVAAITACREAIRLEPNDPRPRSQLARLLVQRGDPAAGLAALEESARLNPAWMTDLKTGFRYHSACCAALAATGKDKTSHPDTEPSVLRQRALDWLTADLAAWRKHLTDSPKARPIVHEQMLDWLKDTHLSSVRDRKDLDKLPIDEQVGWVKLWTAARILRDETAPLPLAPPPRLVK